MSDRIKVLVGGATGQQGGAVARILLKRGHSVKALTRTPESEAAVRLGESGAELVQGSFDDRDSLEQAMRGVDAVYTMSTPFEAGLEAETRQGIMVADAAFSAGVAHFVFSSVGSADQKTGIPHFETKYRVEQQATHPEHRRPVYGGKAGLLLRERVQSLCSSGAYGGKPRVRDAGRPPTPANRCSRHCLFRCSRA